MERVFNYDSLGNLISVVEDGSVRKARLEGYADISKAEFVNADIKRVASVYKDSRMHFERQRNLQSLIVYASDISFLQVLCDGQGILFRAWDGTVYDKGIKYDIQYTNASNKDVTSTINVDMTDVERTLYSDKMIPDLLKIDYDELKLTMPVVRSIKVLKTSQLPEYICDLYFVCLRNSSNTASVISIGSSLQRVIKYEYASITLFRFFISEAEIGMFTQKKDSGDSYLYSYGDTCIRVKIDQTTKIDLRDISNQGSYEELLLDNCGRIVDGISEGKDIICSKVFGKVIETESSSSIRTYYYKGNLINKMKVVYSDGLDKKVSQHFSK